MTPSYFFCLLGAYFFFRLPWIFMVPMVEAPDEFSHFWVIKFLKENWRLPNSADVIQGGASAVYGSLPPFGYLPHVLSACFVGSENLALAERFGSTISGAFMLFAAYKAGKLLFPQYRLAALALPAVIVCHPQLVFIHSYANNDSTSSALASVLIWLMLETVYKGLQFKRTIVMGALVGWLAITKYAGLTVIPVLGLAMVASVFAHGTSLTFAAASIACAGVIAVLLSVWWFVQNAAQFNGDYMGTQTMYKSWAQTYSRDMNYYLPPSHIIKSRAWWRMLFFSFWGMFGYMNKYLWRPVYFGFIGLVVAAALGWLNGLRQLRMVKPKVCDLIAWSSLTLTVLINVAAVVWASTTNLGGPQGRYLVTSEIPLMALIIGGMNHLGIRFRGKFIIAFIAYNIAVCFYSWIYLFHLYHGWHFDPLH